MKNYYHELPLGYKKIKVIDAKNRKTILLFNLAAILMLALAVFSLIQTSSLTYQTIVTIYFGFNDRNDFLYCFA